MKKSTQTAGQVTLTVMMLLSSMLWSYYLYKPLPQDIRNPWKVRLIVSMFKLIEDLAAFSERVGVSTKVHTARIITNSLSSIMSPDSGGLQVYDTEFNGVKVRVYDPVHKHHNGPAIVFYHGGGWFFCNVVVHDHVTRSLAQRLNMVVISVDYRLAPEHPYPAPLDDCITATKHFLSHAAEFDVNAHRVAVMGDSAGGNLAAAVSLALHQSECSIHAGLDQSECVLQPKLQVLVYPALQATDLTLPSFIQNDDLVFGSRHSMAEVLLYYMGEDTRLAAHLVTNNHTTAELRANHSHHLDKSLLPHTFLSPNHSLTHTLADSETFHSPEVASRLKRFVSDPLFAPLVANTLSGLPPAYIITAQYDVLRDEGALYAERLRRDGVSVTWAHYDDAFHGFWVFFNPPLQLDRAAESMDSLISHLTLNL